MDLLKPFRRTPKEKENPVNPGIIALWGKGTHVWSSTNFAALTKAGYQNVSAVFGCVSLISQACGGINWYELNGDKEVENGELTQLFLRPNELDRRATFIKKMVSFMLLSGNSYVLKVAGALGKPRFLYTLRPDRMRIIAGGKANLVGSYEYDVGTGDPQRFDPEEILHLVEFHPTDDFYGLSRLSVAAKSIDISNLSMQWNANLLKNEMRPPGAIQVNGPLTTEQRDILRGDISKYQGADNAGVIPLFESGPGGMQWLDMSIPPKDMDWLNSEKYNLRRICSIFNIASELLGDSENKTYSNIKEARLAFYMEAVLPIMDLLQDELNYWLTPSYGPKVKLQYDRDSIEAIQEDRGKKYAYLTPADWLTVNEKRVATGYEEVGPEGDVILVPIGKTPLIASDSEPPPDEPEEEPEEEETDKPEGEEEEEEAAADGDKRKPYRLKGTGSGGYWATEEKKAALGETFILRVNAKGKSINKLAKEFLTEQATRVRRAIKKAQSVGSVAVRNVIDEKEEGKLFWAKTEKWMVENFRLAGEAGMRSSKGLLFTLDEKEDGGWFQLFPDDLEKLHQMIVHSGTEIAHSTAVKIMDMVGHAQFEAWTVDELSKEIWGKLKEFAPWRSRLIANTETAKVENWGQLEGYKQAEFVEYKGWNCAFLPDSRDDHIIADAQYTAQPIPLDEPFVVGGMAMQYPGDPAGGPEQVCNCYCNTFPEIQEPGEV